MEIPKSPTSSAEGGSNSSSLVAQLTALLDQFEALVPNYTQPDRKRANAVHSNARFAHELITPTITAVMNYEPLRQHNLFDVERGRKALQLRDDLRPIYQRMVVVAGAVAYTIEKELAECAMDALQVYRWSTSHMRHAEGADALRPYVQEMENMVKKTIGRRPKKPPTPVKQE